ncbi:pentapeptide repeat-containing protein [Hymenobacter yonginensis]|uniref:Pentapeptide repeat-containing protein n=1 Tax=Hymenobacter yonginensis TaxID=748197 RepID=A0ABY7PN40_9BACT|nr:pentapeptide repeat-containing protein [Hymenobacter yonginensis]WBO84151.1 pentapeptide repeat-containing protein [Hymenobacter yonginensis]
MRRPASAKPPKPLARPTYFPPENVLERALPPALAGQREFEEYRFRNIDFSEANLAGIRFSDCLFENCNLAGANISQTALQNVAFEGCKLLGLPFHACRDMLFGVHFDRCQLDYASFLGRALPATRFVGCSLQEADFSQANLTAAVFDDCQLTRAIFRQSILVGTDFRTAHGVELDPEQNEVRQARFSRHSLPGLLTKYALVIE